MAKRENCSGSRKSALAQRLDAALPKQHKKVAERIGISSTRLSAYRGGHRTPDPELVGRIADVVGVNLRWLLLGDGPMRGAPIPIAGRPAAGAGLAGANPGDTDLMTQGINQLEAVGGVDQEMSRELLLLTARRVRELERQIAEIVRAIRERGPGTLESKGDET